MTLDKCYLQSFPLNYNPTQFFYTRLAFLLSCTHTTLCLASFLNSHYSYSRNTSPSEQSRTPSPFFNAQLKYHSQPLCLNLQGPSNTARMDHTKKFTLTVHSLSSENYVLLIQLGKCLSDFQLQSNVPGTEIIRAKPLWVSTIVSNFYIPTKSVCSQ